MNEQIRDIQTASSGRGSSSSDDSQKLDIREVGGILEELSFLSERVITFQRFLNIRAEVGILSSK